MGYETEFIGEFTITPRLTPVHREYLAKFSNTRRMKRQATKTVKRPDPIRKAVGLPIGREAEYFVGAEGVMGQEHTEDIVDWNDNPETQPSLWCKWNPNEDGTAIVAPEYPSKFYYYKEWLKYIIVNFLDLWGYKLNGNISWQGEHEEDKGVIVVLNNEITIETHSSDSGE